MTLYEYGESKIQYDEPTNLVDLFEQSITKYKDNKLFGTKTGDGSFTWVTYEDVGKQVELLRTCLAHEQVDLQVGESVGIIADNSIDWAALAFATYGRRARFVPMYEKELCRIWAYTIKDSGLKILFIASPEILEELVPLFHQFPKLETVVVLGSNGAKLKTEQEKTIINESSGEQPHQSINIMSFSEFKQYSKGKTPIPAQKPQYDEIAAVIYTSGTTSDPKGVMLTHGNLTSNVQAGSKRYPELDENACSISILPWAHSYAQTAGLYYSIFIGSRIAFNRTTEELSEDLVTVNPTHLLAVPRLFNAIHDKIHAMMQKKGGISLKLFRAAFEHAKKRRNANKKGFSIKSMIYDVLVFRKLRGRFGNRYKFALTASAKTSNDVLNFFNDAGIRIFDCYGTTETSPAITMNHPKATRFGSVGKPLEKMKVVIDRSKVESGATDGEIVVYGPNVMKGYLNQPEKTKQVLTEDGGYRTGDRGWLDEEGYLYITGRIKQEYKLQNGKYIHPASIEQHIKGLPWISQAYVYGDGQEYNVCLVRPDYELLEGYSKKLDLLLPPSQLIKQPNIQELLNSEIVGHLMNEFGKYEIPKKFHWLEEDFSVENGLLTQTMKLKRRKVYAKYKDEIQALYR